MEILCNVYFVQVVADINGFVAPFDLSIFVLMAMVLLICYFWNENYGDSEMAFFSNFSAAVKAVSGGNFSFIFLRRKGNTVVRRNTIVSGYEYFGFRTESRRNICCKIRRKV